MLQLAVSDLLTFQVFTVSPVLSNAWALLGEPDKYGMHAGGMAGDESLSCRAGCAADTPPMLHRSPRWVTVSADRFSDLAYEGSRASVRVTGDPEEVGPWLPQRGRRGGGGELSVASSPPPPPRR